MELICRVILTGGGLEGTKKTPAKCHWILVILDSTDRLLPIC
jgi:hypothetical protein